MLETHAVHEEVQWLGMNTWLGDRETKWEGHHKANLPCGMGILDMTTEVLAIARVCEAAPAQDTSKDRRDETARQDVGGLVVSQHADPMGDGEPEKHQLQQQPKPKPKPQLTLEHEP